MTTTPESPTGAERRRAVRRQPAVGTYFYLESSPPPERGFGLIWNISTSGISMLTPENPERGAMLRGFLVSNDGMTRLPVSFRVVHLRQIESGDHFLGAQFEEPLTEEQLRPFLFE